MFSVEQMESLKKYVPTLNVQAFEADLNLLRMVEPESEAGHAVVGLVEDLREIVSKVHQEMSIDWNDVIDDNDPNETLQYIDEWPDHEINDPVMAIAELIETIAKMQDRVDELEQQLTECEELYAETSEKLREHETTIVWNMSRE